MTHSEIVNVILERIYATNPLAASSKPLPLDTSLMELGIMDSFGIVELVSFIETHWGIKILNSELNQETFAGVNKQAALVLKKLSEKGAAPLPGESAR